MWTYLNKTTMNNLHLQIYEESSKGINGITSLDRHSAQD